MRLISIGLFAACIALLMTQSCDGGRLLTDESASKSSSKGGNDSVADPLDMVDPAEAECEEGKSMQDDCATCICSGGYWNCDDVVCEDTDRGLDDGLDVVSCDALGLTWRFAAGQCFLEEWAGCGPSGVFYQNLRACIEANGVEVDLQWLPVGESCTSYLQGNESLIQVAPCGAGVVAGVPCTGNNGPGCSGEDCEAMEATVCLDAESDLLLGCRSVEHVCDVN